MPPDPPSISMLHMLILHNKSGIINHLIERVPLLFYAPGPYFLLAPLIGIMALVERTKLVALIWDCTLSPIVSIGPLD